MADSFVQQKIDLIEFYYVNGKSKAEAVRKMKTKYGKDLNFSDSTLARYIEKFITTGSMDDQRSSQPGPSYTVTTPEVLDVVEKHFEENPNDSIRKAADKLGLNRETLRLIMRRFLKMFPYKISIHQKLTEAAMAKRKEFCEKVYSMIENEELDVDKIIFSDEAHFHLDGYVNKQNYRYWGTQPPVFMQSKSAHPQRLTAWAAITRNKICIHFTRENVTGETYNHLLNRVFFPWCTRSRIARDSWFMQDGATPHRTREVFETLHRKFGNNVIGLGYPKFCGGGIEWPPYSPDLNPCDFFLWGFLKDGVYRDSPKTLNDLEKAIKNKLAQVDDEMLNNVYSSFVRRLEYCSNSSGNHFEHVYT